jgi:hypothetical protein
MIRQLAASMNWEVDYAALPAATPQLQAPIEMPKAELQQKPMNTAAETTDFEEV